MTREERLDWLRQLRSEIPYMNISIDVGVSLERKKQYRQSLSEIIETLEQEPCENWYDVPSDEMTLEQARQAVRDLRKMWVEHLEQEPCEDAVSRQAALDAFGLSEKSRKYGGDHSGYDTIMLYEVQDALEALPSVQPQPKIGHWIRWYEQKENDGCIEYIPHCKCSECGKEYDPHSSQFVKYCNECGAKMIEPQESEE